jgi:hypothetical protein
VTEVGGALQCQQQTQKIRTNFIPHIFKYIFFMQLQQLIKKAAFIILAIMLVVSTATAQDLLMGNNLANVRVDQVSDADIAKLKAQLSGKGMSIEQAEPMAIAKGMSAAEFAKLKDRVKNGGIITAAGANKTGPVSARDASASDKPDTEKYNEASAKPLIDPLIFGSELYTSVAPSFEPNMSLATPLNYVLGPNDQIAVSVYGVQEYSGELTVSPEGNVSIPNVGLIRVQRYTITYVVEVVKLLLLLAKYAPLK